MNNLNTMTTFYIVRHGESEGNANFGSGKTTVATDLGTGLTELGKSQATKRAADLQHIHFDAVFSSDLTRAHQTAQILKLEREIEVQTTKALRERHKGSLKAESEKELRNMFKELYEAYDQMNDEEKFKFKVVPDMESQEDAASRVITFLRELAVAYPGKTLLIVSHSLIVRTLLIKLGYGTFSEFPSGAVENTGYIVLESDGVDFNVKELVGVNRSNKANEE